MQLHTKYIQQFRSKYAEWHQQKRTRGSETMKIKDGFDWKIILVEPFSFKSY